MKFGASEISKRFGPTVALSGVSLELEAGQIHALCGGNGSGKSTLIKTITGVERADSGTFSNRDDLIEAGEMTPSLAAGWGVRCLHQQGSTFGSLSVAENLAAGVGFATTFPGKISWRQTMRHAREVLAEYEIDVRPEQLLDELRPVNRQLVAIARVLQDTADGSAGILILDEPTASLAGTDVDKLHEVVTRLAAGGTAVVYVTHRLGDLPGFASVATVLRDGEVVGRLDAGEIQHERLVELIVGVTEAELNAAAVEHAPVGNRAERLVVTGLSGGPVRRADFSVGVGEIVGISGLVGSGRSSILEMIYGMHKPDSGSISIDGKKLGWRSGRAQKGVAMVPENRVVDGAFLPLSVTENLVATTTGQCWHNGFINHRAERAQVRRMIVDHGIRAASEEVPFQTLSGGNQQKAIIARCLRSQPRVLLLDEPTQGVDFAARAAIHNTIRSAAAEGMSVLVVSADVEELVLLCNRVVVLAEGETVCELAGAQLTADRLERLSFGTGVASV